MRRTDASLRGRPGSIPAAQAGFTLIEMLVTMLVSVIVIGGGVWGIARAFQQSTGSTNRVLASRSAEVGLEALTRDLREAVSCPSVTSAGTTTYPADPASNHVVGVYVSGPTSNLETIDMCDPTPGLTPQATTPNSSQISTSIAVPVTVLVNWTCNLGTTAVTPTGWSTTLGAETCERTWESIDPSSLAVGNPTPGLSFRGVTGLALYGVLGTNTGSQALACTTGCSYVLTSGASNSLSWLGYNATVATLENTSGLTNTTTVAGTSPITIRSGAALENYGT